MPPPPPAGRRADAAPHASDANLGYLLVKASRAWDRALVAALAARGFPDSKPSHGAVLIPLFDGGPCTITDMVAASHLTKQTLSIYVRELKERGIVATGPHPDDGRAVLVRLTPKGRKLQAAAAEAVAEVNAGFEAQLGVARMSELRRLLQAALPDAPTDEDS